MKNIDLKYKIQNSILTFADGITEFRKFDVQKDEAERVSEELLRDIDEHDAIHTLFGCSTDLIGEILAHVWTYFGTTTETSQMIKVNRHKDHKAALQEIGHLRLLKSWLLNFVSIIKVILKAKRMKHKFPILEYENYLDQELCEIRTEFNIVI